jgi:hypothetical protein
MGQGQTNQPVVIPTERQFAHGWKLEFDAQGNIDRLRGIGRPNAWLRERAGNRLGRCRDPRGQAAL